MKKYVPVINSKWTFENLLKVVVHVWQFPKKKRVYMQEQWHLNLAGSHALRRSVKAYPAIENRLSQRLEMER